MCIVNTIYLLGQWTKYIVTHAARIPINLQLNILWFPMYNKCFSNRA